MKRILVVEEDVVAARRLGSYWGKRGFEVRIVTEVRRAAVEANRWRPDLITLDAGGDREKTEETLLQLRSRPQTCRTPAIILARRAGDIPSRRLREGDRVIVGTSPQFERLLKEAAPPVPAGC